MRETSEQFKPPYRGQKPRPTPNRFQKFCGRFSVFVSVMRDRFEAEENQAKTDWHTLEPAQIAAGLSKAQGDLDALLPRTVEEGEKLLADDRYRVLIRRKAADVANWSFIAADYWNHPSRGRASER